jgi:putative tryptophan/tyrosine transport system substrate-binding protein
MTQPVNRRSFLAGAGASVIVSRGAWGQQPQRPNRVALVATGISSLDLSENGHPDYAALLGELRRLGHGEGASIAFERWGAAGLAETEFARLAQRVVETRPDLVFVSGARLASAVKNATSDIPVVFLASTPIEFGLVASLARPGGNLTGFASDTGTEIGGKRLQILTQSKPEITQVIWLGTPQLWAAPYTEPLRAAATQLGVTVVPALIEGQVTEAAIKQTLAGFQGRKNLGLFIPLAVDFNVQARVIAEIALANGWPGSGESRELAAAGLLLSYGADRSALMRGAAGYIDRILKGAKPSELPVQQPTKFELVANLKTARALGIELPLGVLGLVSEYIE